MIAAAKRNFGGRLNIVEQDGAVTIDYCTGQYWPTEYRRAVAAVLAGALWQYWGECAITKTANDIRKLARIELGRTIANHYFN